MPIISPLTSADPKQRASSRSHLVPEATGRTTIRDVGKTNPRKEEMGGITVWDMGGGSEEGTREGGEAGGSSTWG